MQAADNKIFDRDSGAGDAVKKVDMPLLALEIGYSFLLHSERFQVPWTISVSNEIEMA